MNMSVYRVLCSLNVSVWLRVCVCACTKDSSNTKNAQWYISSHFHLSFSHAYCSVRRGLCRFLCNLLNIHLASVWFLSHRFKPTVRNVYSIFTGSVRSLKTYSLTSLWSYVRLWHYCELRNWCGVLGSGQLFLCFCSPPSQALFLSSSLSPHIVDTIPGVRGDRISPDDKQLSVQFPSFAPSPPPPTSLRLRLCDCLFRYAFSSH